MAKELIMVGDRVLILPDEGEDKTSSGLYLPQGVKEKEDVQSGNIIKIGPGYPLPDYSGIDEEPWQVHKSERKYLPLQAQEGDYCIYLRKSAVEIEFEGKKYMVVPHAAILMLLRNQNELPAV